MLPPAALAANRDVLARMADYLGGSSLETATTVFLSRCDLYTHDAFETRLPAELPYYLEHGFDVGRSLWDRQSFLVHLDLDYFNFDFPAEPYLDRHRIFAVQEPVAAAVQDFLAGHGIEPLHLITGRGHHFVWRCDQESRAVRELTAWGRLPPAIENLCRQSCAPTGETVPLALVRAYVGLGRVMEWASHRIKRLADPGCPLPLRITAVKVGHGQRGREIACLDISAFADPLHTRVIRIPFSVYGKPRVKEDIPSPGNGGIPEIICIPLPPGMDIRTAVEITEQVEQVMSLARRVSVRIPDFTGAMDRLLAAYDSSGLKRFHDWYYSQEPASPENWPHTYDRFDPGGLPPCVGEMLARPGEFLIDAAAMQLLVRTLLALGWHPRQVGGLIRSKYERTRYGWGVQWRLFNPAIRSDFYARLFAGMIATGLDDLEDFSCEETKAKGLCPGACRAGDLEPHKEKLWKRWSDDRFSDRHIDRVLLSATDSGGA